MTLISHRSRSFTLLAALVLVAGIVFLAGPGQAAAQQPAICEEYPELPICDEGGGGNNPTDDDDDEDADDTAPGASAGGTGDGDGDLPFTGYPITDLLLLFAVLLVAGLAIRGYLSLRERARATRAP